MAEIRCPMCGKTNPAQTDTCQFCQARITPLTIDPSPAPSQPPEHAGDDELSDWQNINWGDDTDMDEDAFDDGDALGWLNRLRDDSESEEPAESLPFESAPDAAEPEGGGDDWLQRIQTLRDADPLAPNQPDSGPFSAAFDPQNADADDNGLPDWLDQFNAERETPPVQDADLPDWLSASDSEDSSFTRAPADEPLPDWLSAADPADQSLTDQPSFAAESPALSPQEDASAIDPDIQIPDWLADLGDDAAPAVEQPAAAASTTTDDVPDWLSGLGAEIETDAAASDDAELPDWLADLGDDAAPAVEQPAAAASTTTDDVPDWLSGLGAEIETDAAASDDAELPDWLAAEATPKEITPAPALGPVPDWLADGAGIALSDAPSDFAVEESSESDILGWFADMDAQSDADQTVFAADSGAVPEMEAGDAAPDWLQNLGAADMPPADDDLSASATGLDAPFIPEDDLDEALIDTAGLPDWLSDVTTSAEPTGPVPDESDLTPAELPNWLKAMRPVDSAAQAVSPEDEPVESAGPLAGLRGVLAAEPEIATIGTPAQYSAKIEIHALHSEHAKALTALLALETEAQPITKESIISAQRVLRWIISVLLIMVVGFVVINESDNVAFPTVASMPGQTAAASRIVSDIANEAPVLIAFDYEPGLSGEMHATAAALVDHLMLKAARLTLVSTLPTGPAQAEYFMDYIQTKHQYIAGQQYVNLGYIPGGAAGLQSFAQTPRLTFPATSAERDIWETAPLQNIASLSDFALVVLITTDPDTARAWIEQVEPHLQQTPFLAVVSAQAEPMVRPYFGTQPDAQVNGIVSGLNGAAAYEVAVGRPNLGRVYWDAYSVGLIVAVGAILVGGLVNISTRILARNTKTQEGAK